MEIYDTEEEQVEALKGWWKENKSSVISGTIASIVIMGGWNFWESYQKDKMQQASGIYEKLLKADVADKDESVEKLAGKLSVNFSATAYSAYGLLFEAKDKVEQKDLKGAQALLSQAMSITDDMTIQHIARTRLIRVLLADKTYEQGLQVIAGVDQATIEGFEGIYEELKGDLYVAMARIGEARTAYQAALKAGASSPLLQFKLDDLSLAEG